MKSNKKNIRIAAFGFRSIPFTEGSAGADKFALELYSRIASKGISIVAYNRLYKYLKEKPRYYNGIRLKHIRTINISGFDSLLHSLLSTIHIILFNTGNVIHIHNGGNSIFALFLRLFRKKVYISQDGVDWKRDKWKWYAKFYLYLSSFITAYLPNYVIFDNVFSQKLFEEKFKRKYIYIPYGSEVPEFTENKSILQKLDLKEKGYYLFIGRFIPDKGLHYLIPAFEKVNTEKKLVIVGGSPNPTDYEKLIKRTIDKRIIFPGFMYGDDSLTLMKNAYVYIQPSDVEGLSPVILSVMAIGTPLICSNIEENIFVVKDTAIIFKKSDVNSLKEKIEYSIENYHNMYDLSLKAKKRALKEFSWNKVSEEHLNLFNKCLKFK